MTELSCYIVEDDLQAFEYAKSIIQKFGNINVIGHATTIKKAANQISNLHPDFIILDVFLEDGTAFEFLQLFERIDFKIIFTTSYAKYAIEAFKFSAIDYLLKPYEENELISALNKVNIDFEKGSYELQLKSLLQNLSTPQKLKKIVLKNSDEINIVAIDDILFAKADNNYTTFILNNGKEILVSKHLKSFEDKLSPYHFFRVHQSYLINLTHITTFDKRNDDIVLTQTHRIPVAQSRKKQLLDLLEKNL